MKKILVVLMLFTFSQAFSQKYMDKIAQNSCDCFNNVKDVKDKDQMTMQLGLCMLESAMPYQKQLKKDYGIDLENSSLEQEGEKLGRVIAMKMASHCPDALMKMAEVAGGDEEAAEGTGTFKGTVYKIDEDTFVAFSVKDETGKLTKFYWLTFVESGMELTNKYKTLAGKPVEISYQTLELFDPKNKEYRTYNVISSIELAE